MKIQKKLEIEYLNECQIKDYFIIGSYYIGYHEMMFGTRVRAGKLFDFSCDIDVCCGKGQYLKGIVKDLYSKKMQQNYQNRKPILAGLLVSSEIKPINKDPNFMSWMAELMDELKNK